MPPKTTSTTDNNSDVRCYCVTHRPSPASLRCHYCRVSCFFQARKAMCSAVSLQECGHVLPPMSEETRLEYQITQLSSWSVRRSVARLETDFEPTVVSSLQLLAASRLGQTNWKCKSCAKVLMVFFCVLCSVWFGIFLLRPPCGCKCCYCVFRKGLPIEVKHGVRLTGVCRKFKCVRRLQDWKSCFYLVLC